jgi:hypothetical protein
LQSPALSNGRTDSWPQGEEIYVSCAGVVLLHPFLERFFKRLGLLERPADGWQARAAHLLYFLVSGREQPEEQETTLLKLLCGLQLDEPLVRELPLSPGEREEADMLLRAAISHWERLKNTSPDGLREAFLQREGRLAQEEAGWRLTVEQRGVDALLGSLPWNLSTVRLAWMAAPLWVDWA